MRICFCGSDMIGWRAAPEAGATPDAAAGEDGGEMAEAEAAEEEDDDNARASWSSIEAARVRYCCGSVSLT